MASLKMRLMIFYQIHQLERASRVFQNFPSRNFQLRFSVQNPRWIASSSMDGGYDYTLTFYLFKDPFKHVKQEKSTVCHVSWFERKIYVHNWYQVHSACSACRKDLLRLKNLNEW